MHRRYRWGGSEQTVHRAGCVEPERDVGTAAHGQIGTAGVVVRHQTVAPAGHPEGLLLHGGNLVVGNEHLGQVAMAQSDSAGFQPMWQHLERGDEAAKPQDPVDGGDKQHPPQPGPGHQQFDYEDFDGDRQQHEDQQCSAPRAPVVTELPRAWAPAPEEPEEQAGDHPRLQRHYASEGPRQQHGEAVF